jgi:oligoendopeptidase F
MSEINYNQSAWSLTDLFAGGKDDVEGAFSQLEALVADFAAQRSALRVGMPFDEFQSLVRSLEQLQELAWRLYGYTSLGFSADTQDQTFMTLMSRVQQFVAEMENHTLFFSLWWKSLDESDAARLMQDAGDWLYWLEEMRHFKPHTLSEAEEKIVNIKNVTGSSAIERLYDTLTNRYTFKLEVNGEIKEMTRGELMVYVRQPDPDLRERAYRELYRVYSNDGTILGQMYQTLARDWRNENVQLRNFTSPISVRNLANDIPDGVIDTLLDVAQKNTGLFQRFFRLKARWLGIERLRRCDLYAPVATTDKTYPYADAAQMVLESFRSFDPQFATMAQRVFDQGHLDSEVRKGKRGGAFCSTVHPRITPWVLINYQGRTDDVSTLAHELGHAVHSMMAAEHSILTAHACLPLAETASTFGEMMLVDRLLAEEKDEGVRRDILFSQIDGAYATIQRQAYFALFEKQAHEMVNQNASVDEMSAAYLANLKDQFGDAVEVDEDFRWEWVSIPHIFRTPFYVYAYAFGQLLVLSLYRQYRIEGEAFKPRYKQLLAAGGSKSPAQILADAGIDMYSPAFWQGGYDVIAEQIAELEKLPVG